jgi:hypothetical protein
MSRRLDWDEEPVPAGLLNLRSGARRRMDDEPAEDHDRGARKLGGEAGAWRAGLDVAAVRNRYAWPMQGHPRTHSFRRLVLDLAGLRDASRGVQDLER